MGSPLDLSRGGSALSLSHTTLPTLLCVSWSQRSLNVSANSEAVTTNAFNVLYGTKIPVKGEIMKTNIRKVPWAPGFVPAGCRWWSSCSLTGLSRGNPSHAESNESWWKNLAKVRSPHRWIRLGSQLLCRAALRADTDWRAAILTRSAAPPGVAPTSPLNVDFHANAEVGVSSFFHNLVDVDLPELAGKRWNLKFKNLV